jgi:hypothetical protein
VLHYLVVVRAMRSDRLGFALVLLGVTAYMWRIVDPAASGMVAGIDVGFDVAYAESFRRQLLEHHDVLSWLETAFDGMPLLGHPLNQILYPPFLIPVLLLGVDAGVRAVYYFSAVLAAVGMYVLCRYLAARPSVAAWAALVFVMSGTMASRLYAGHVERVLAIPLLPWILAALVLSARAPNIRLRIAAAAAAGILHGYVLLAGDPYLAFMLLAAVPIAQLAFARNWRSAVANVAVSFGALAFIVSPKLVAVVPFLSETIRSAASPYQGSQDFYWAAAHLVFPFFATGPVLPFGSAPTPISYRGIVPGGGEYSWWEYTQYLGIVAVVFAVFAPLAAGLRRFMPDGFRLWSTAHYGARHIAGLVGVALLGAMWLANANAYSPIHWLYQFDQLNVLRAPSRGLILTGVAALGVAAVGFESALRIGRSRRFICWILALCGTAGVVDVYLVDGWIPRIVDPPYRTSVEGVVDQLRTSDSGPFVVDISAFDYRSAGSVVLALAMRDVRVADALSPLQPRAQSAHLLVRPEDHVRYKLVPAGQGAPVPPWQPLLERDGLVVLVNTRPQADFWLVIGDSVLGRRGSITRTTSGYTVYTEAERPASIVVPANAFAGWSAQVDGRAVPIHKVDGYVATAAVDGSHTYVFSYRQPLLDLTLVLTVLGWILSAATLVLVVRSRHPFPDIDGISKPGR